jgi:hypothetical protein
MAANERIRIHSSLVLDIDQLLKGTDRKRNIRLKGASVFDGATVSVQVVLNGFDRYIEVTYERGQSNFDYLIMIEGVFSNLGFKKGENFYLICPISGKRCKKLYLAYDSCHFKHRSTYGKGLRYPCQYLSKNDRKDQRLVQLEFTIDLLKVSLKRTRYGGKMTRLRKRYRKWDKRLRILHSNRSYEILLQLIKRPPKLKIPKWEYTPETY